MFALTLKVSAAMPIFLPDPVVVTAALIETVPPRRTMSPAICLVPVMLIVPELEGVPTSNEEAELEIVKLLPSVMEVEKEVLAGITFIDPEELKLKSALALSQMVSISKTAPPPAV